MNFEASTHRTRWIFDESTLVRIQNGSWLLGPHGRPPWKRGAASCAPPQRRSLLRPRPAPADLSLAPAAPFGASPDTAATAALTRRPPSARRRAPRRWAVASARASQRPAATRRRRRTRRSSGVRRRLCWRPPTWPHTSLAHTGPGLQSAALRAVPSTRPAARQRAQPGLANCAPSRPYRMLPPTPHLAAPRPRGSRCPRDGRRGGAGAAFV